MIAISTAYKKALIAVELGGKKEFKELDSNCKHAENILPAIDNAIEKLNENIDSNDCFSVVIGPGSFTGLRISLALVKGFLAGKEQNLVCLTTNELMAYSYLKGTKVKDKFLTVIDALSGLCYICEFDLKGQKLGEEQLIEKEELSKKDIFKVGLREENLELDDFVDPTAEDLLELSNRLKEEKKFVQIDNLAPLYLRKSQAEDSLEKKI